MSFRFSLATVLRVRVQREEHEERVLQQILQEITRAQSSIQHLDLEVSRVNRERVERRSTMQAGRDLHMESRDVGQLQLWRKELEAQLERLEQLKEEQLLRYQSARRDRELLAGLHTRQRALYDADRAMREQQTIADSFVARRLRG